MSDKSMSALKEAILHLPPERTHVLEFGVYQGKTIRFLRENLHSAYKIFGFDSFEGLPEDWKGTKCKKGHFNTNGQIPTTRNVHFIKGLFENTIPHYLERAEPIALLHMDCDLYSSAKTVFEGVNDYIGPGTIIAFDEWCYNHSVDNYDHEQRAFWEWVKSTEREYEFVPFAGHDSPKCEQKLVRILSWGTKRKPWGWEEIRVNNRRYVVKRLTMRKGHCCSQQYHVKKHETILGVEGELQVELPTGFKIILPGDILDIPPGTIHRMRGNTDCVYMECSTPELHDVVRLDDQYGRK